MQEFQASSEKANEAVKKSFGTVSKVVAGVGIAIGLAVLAVAGKAVAFADDFKKALNGLQSSTGETDKEMQGFKGTMLSLYNQNYGENFQEIADAMKEVKTQTGLGGQALEDMTKKAFILKDTFGLEIVDSVKASNQMMQQFGITSDQAMSLMAQGAQNGLDANGEMIDSISEYSVQFAGVGLSAEDMFNMMNNGMKGGAFSVDKIGDAVKEFGILSKESGGNASKAYKMLGMDADGLAKSFGKGGAEGKKAFEDVNKKLLAMKDPTAQASAGTLLYGSMFEDLGIKGIKAMQGTEGAINKTKDAMSGIEKIKYNTFGEGMAGIGRVIMTSVFIPIGEKLIPKLQEMSQYIIDNMPKIKQNITSALEFINPIIDKVVDGFKKLTDALSTVSTWVSEHQTAVQNIAIIVGAFALAWGLVTGAIAIWNVVGLIATAVTSGFGLALAFLTSPIGIVILAIGAIIAVGVLLYKNWDVIKAKATVIFSGIWTAIKGAFASTVSWFAGIWNGIKNVFAVVGAWFSGIFSACWEGIKSIWNAVKPFFQAVWNGIKIIFGVIAIVLLAPFFIAWEGIKAVFGVAVAFFALVWEGIKAIFSVVATFLIGYFTPAWNGIKLVFSLAVAFFQAVWNGIKIIFSVVGTVLLAFFTVAWTMIKAYVSVWVAFFQGVWNGIKLVFSVVSSVLVGFFTIAWNGIKAVWNTVKGWFQAIWNSIKLVFSVVGSVLLGFFTTAWNGIKTVWNAVGSFFQGIWNGIKNVFNVVSSFFTGVFSSAWTAIKGVFAPVGTFFSGIWDTIKSKFTSIGTSIGTAVGGAFKGTVNAVINFASNSINGFIRGINSAIGVINKIPGVSIGNVHEISIPRLARGGVVDSAQTFIAGEHGKEVVMPLENNTGWISQLADKVSDRMPNKDNGNGGLNVTITNFINNREQDVQALAEELAFYARQKELGGGH